MARLTSHRQIDDGCQHRFDAAGTGSGVETELCATAFVLADELGPEERDQPAQVFCRQPVERAAHGPRANDGPIVVSSTCYVPSGQLAGSRSDGERCRRLILGLDADDGRVRARLAKN